MPVTGCRKVRCVVSVVVRRTRIGPSLYAGMTSTVMFLFRRTCGGQEEESSQEGRKEEGREEEGSQEGC